MCPSCWELWHRNSCMFGIFGGGRGLWNHESHLAPPPAHTLPLLWAYEWSNTINAALSSPSLSEPPFYLSLSLCVSLFHCVYGWERDRQKESVCVCLFLASCVWVLVSATCSHWKRIAGPSDAWTLPTSGTQGQASLLGCETLGVAHEGSAPGHLHSERQTDTLMRNYPWTKRAVWNSRPVSPPHPTMACKT